jgi:ATP-dependent Clp protease ATP-binding subunit ClpA
MAEKNCSKCGKQPGTIPVKKVKGGVTVEELLCIACAEEIAGGKSSSQQQSRKEKLNKSPNLDRYAVSLSELAAEGKILKVIGREKEIEQTIQVLCRKFKCNPCLIGEPGVGKTVIAEWLAQLIHDKKVPAMLQGKEVYSLDMTALQAGTGIIGTLEDRVSKILKEVENRGNIILFVDEVHRIVGAGSTNTDPSGDTANMLKPALARGKFMMISATTLDEYRQLEKDSALERRLQPIIIDEPSIDDTIEILLSIKEKYENRFEDHKIVIPDGVIRSAVRLADKYIVDRFFPDKAITLIDQAGTNRYLQNDKERREGASSVDNTLSVKDVIKVIEDQTKIPVMQSGEEETLRLLELEKNMKKGIIGQDEAIETVCSAIRRKRVSISRKLKPVSFVFIGPTGVGKTELGKKLNEELFGPGGALVRLDMSEFQNSIDLSKILGAAPGYVGYGKTGQLEGVRKNPFCVVLVDEIEKAHPDVMNIFLQILDDGHIKDGQSRKIDFRHAIIIMTSNAGSTVKEKTLGFNRSGDSDAKERAVDALKKFLKPEIINRLDGVVYFKNLSQDSIRSIAKILLEDLCKSLAEREENPLKLSYGDEVLDHLAKDGYSEEYGARNLRRMVESDIENEIAILILESLKNQCTLSALKLVVQDDMIKVEAVKE